jgi:hypothetical protein
MMPSSFWYLRLEIYSDQPMNTQGKRYGEFSLPEKTSNLF